MVKMRSIFFGMGVLLIGVSVAQADIPQPMHFSGQLSKEKKPFTGTSSLTFALYEKEVAKEGEEVLWTETLAVSMFFGRFHVQLGADLNNPIENKILNAARFLGIKVEEDDELSPRLALSSVPFARFAGDAKTVGGKSSDDFTLNDQDCGSGQVMKGLNADGTLNCVTDATGGSSGGGDITGVSAGTGLLGGGNSGQVSLSANAGYLQRRVTGTCGSNHAIRVISATGGVTCDDDDDTTYSAGAGLSLSGTAFSLDASGCVAGEVLKRNSANTGWECVAGGSSGSSYSAGAGLSLSGSQFSLNATGCVAGEVLKRNSANNGWACVIDEDSGASLATVAHTGSFTHLVDVPAGLADGDDDTVGALNCGANESVQWNATSSAWECLSSGEQVPIGTIIDWWRPNANVAIPTGYNICDGSEIIATQSPWNGQTVPDLSGKFVRGVVQASDIGTTGGADTHTHTTSVDHNHASATTSDDGSHSHTYNKTHNHDAAESTSDAGYAHIHHMSNVSSVTDFQETGCHDHEYSIDHNHGGIGHSTKSSSHNHEWSNFDSGEDWGTFDSSGAGKEIINWINGFDGEGSGIYAIAKDTTSSSTQRYYTNNHSHAHNLNTITGNYDDQTTELNPTDPQSGKCGFHDHTLSYHLGTTSEGTNSIDDPDGSGNMFDEHSHTVDLGQYKETPENKNTGSQNDHSHTVDLANFNVSDRTSSAGSTLPSYVGLLKLMRVY